MSFTLLDLKRSIMDSIGEDSSSPTYWTSLNDGELEDYINDALGEVCLLSGHYTETLHLPLFSNRQHYRLDPGKGGEFLYIKGIRVLPEEYDLSMTDMNKLSKEDYLWMTRTGTPRTFFQIGLDTIRPVPIPSSGGKSLEITACVIPPPYTNDMDEIDLDDSLIEVIVAYATYMLLLSKRKLESADVWMKTYMKASGLSEENGSFLGRSVKLQGLMEKVNGYVTK